LCCLIPASLGTISTHDQADKEGVIQCKKASCKIHLVAKFGSKTVAKILIAAIQVNFVSHLFVNCFSLLQEEEFERTT